MAKNTQLVMDIGQGLSMMVGLPAIDSWDIESRPKNARPGTFGFNFQTNSLEYWDGVDWFAAVMSSE